MLALVLYSLLTADPKPSSEPPAGPEGVHSERANAHSDTPSQERSPSTGERRAVPTDESAQVAPLPETPGAPGIVADPFEARYASPSRRADPTGEVPNVGPPSHKGTGLIVSGAVLGVAALGAQAYVMSQVLQLLQYCPNEASPESCDDVALGAGLVAVWGGPSTKIVSSVAIGLLSGGLFRRGRWQAFTDGQPTERRTKLKRRAIAGWLLIGVGVVLQTASMAAFSCRHRCFALMYGVLDISGTALAGTGLALTPYASGYLMGLPKEGGATVVPTLLPGGLGVGISGRF